MHSRIKLWLTLLFVVSVELKSFKDGFQDDVPFNSTFLTYQQFKQKSIDFSPEGITSLSNIPHSRFKRATDNLKPVVDRLQKLARVTNGILILQGLASGEIPSGELISELLFLDKSSLAKFPKVTAAINSMKNVPRMLASTAETNKVETGLKVLKNMKNIVEKSNRIKNLSDFDGDHFKQEISRMAGNGINTGIFGLVGAFAFSWGNEYNSVFTGNPPVSKTTFKNIKYALEAIKDGIPNIESSIKNWNFDNFGKLMDGIALLTKTANGTDIINTSSQTLSDADVQKYIQYVETEAKKTKELDTSLIADFREVMTKLVMRPRTRSLQHTHGLSNGSPDFVQMLDDVNDKWIKKLIRTDELQIQFKRLTNVSNAIKGMDDSLHFVKEDRRSIILILEYGRLVDKATNIEQLKRSAFKMCSIAQPNNTQKTEFTDFRKNLKQMDDKFSMLKTQTNLFSEALLTPGLDKMCDEVITIINGASDIPTATKHLKEYKQLEALNSIIQKLAKSFNSIKDNALSTFAVNLNTTITVFDRFLQYLNSYSEYFECLQNQEELKLLIELAADIEILRSRKNVQTLPKLIHAGLLTAKKVEKVSKEIDTLKTTLDNMKGGKVFVGLLDASSHNRIVGYAAQGISNMENALIQKAYVNQTIEQLSVFKAYQHLAKDGDVNFLKTIMKLETTIPAMYKTLDQFVRGTKDFDSNLIEDYSVIFENALSVTGIDVIWFAIQMTIRNLKEQITDQGDMKKLEELAEKLETIDSMGLSFNSFQTAFGGSRAAFKVLDAFFGNYPEELTTSDLKEALPELWFQKYLDDQIIFYCSIGGLVFLIILIFHLLMCICCRPHLIKGYRAVFCHTKKKSDLELFEKYLDSMMAMIAESEKVEVDELLKMNAAETVYKVLLSKYDAEPKLPKVDEDPIKQSKLEDELGIRLKWYGNRFYESGIYARTYRDRDGKVVLVATETPREMEYEEGCPEEMRITRADSSKRFWWLVKQLKCRNVIMLCPHHVYRRLLNNKPAVTTDRLFHAYDFFPSRLGEQMHYGDIDLTCTGCNKLEEVTNKVDEIEYGLIELEVMVEIPRVRKFFVNFRWLPHWEQLGTLASEELRTAKLNSSVGPLIQALKVIKTSKSPPILVSHDGKKRCGVVAFVVKMLEILNFDKPFVYGGIVWKHKKVSPTYIQNHRDYQYAAYIILEYLIHDLKISDEKMLKKYNWLKTGLDSFMDVYMKNHPPAEKWQVDYTD